MKTIRDMLIAARKDVEEAEIPEDLKEVAFRSALELHAREGGLNTNGGMGGGGAGSHESQTPGGSGSIPDGDGPLSSIAKALGVELDLVSDVYNENNGDIELIVGIGKLPSKTASATKELALLVAAGRQGAGEEWTPLNAVRTVCDDYKKLDSPNFSSTIKEMDDLLRFRGTPRKREIRMAKPAWDEAAALVRRVAGTE